MEEEEEEEETIILGYINLCHSTQNNAQTVPHQLFIVICLEIPQMNHTALVAHHQLCLVWVQTDTVHWCRHLENSLALQVP